MYTVNDIEERTRVESKFRYPKFEEMQWYAADYLVRSATALPTFVQQGLPVLLDKVCNTYDLLLKEAFEQCKHGQNIWFRTNNIVVCWVSTFPCMFTFSIIQVLFVSPA